MQDIVCAKDLPGDFVDLSDSKAVKSRGAYFEFKLGTNKKPAQTYICLPQDLPSDGLHERRLGVNEVTVREFVAKEAIVLIPYTYLQENSLQLLGKYKLLIGLLKKQGVVWELVSFATKKSQLRSANDVAALKRLLE